MLQNEDPFPSPSWSACQAIPLARRPARKHRQLLASRCTAVPSAQPGCSEWIPRLASRLSMHTRAVRRSGQHWGCVVLSSLSSKAAGRIPGSPKSDHSLKGPTRPPKLHRKTDLGRAQVLAALGAHGRRAVLNGAGAPHVADAGGAAVAQLPLLGVQLDLGHLLGCQACGLHLCHQSCVGDDWLSGPCISGCSWYLVHNPGANPWTVRRRELGPSAAADSQQCQSGGRQARCPKGCGEHGAAMLCAGRLHAWALRSCCVACGHAAGRSLVGLSQ